MSASRLVTLADLKEIAAELWSELGCGGVVWLSGDLGSGKTAFVQQLTDVAAAAPARSPTYSLVHRYGSPDGDIVHVDCYRFRRPDEAIDLDFPTLQREARMLLVEWPERGGGYVPDPDVHLRFEHADDADRRRLERIA